MNVGFYYHVEAVFEPDGAARVPALLGMFIEQLASSAGRVTFYAHGESRAGIEDYRLTEPLVRCVNLGPRASFPERLFVPSRSLRAFRPQGDGLDVMLVRGPSALLPGIVAASRDIPTALHIVGDYSDQKRDPKARDMPWWRDRAIRAAFKVYSRRQRRAARDALVLVNALQLAERFAGHPHVEVVFESTLTEAMLASSPRTGAPGLGRARPARLLCTGRLIPEKGLWEAVEALRLLVARGWHAELDVVGWEAPGDPVVGNLREHARALGVFERVHFRGYVPAGSQLADVYREADIFVLASHGDAEGFPRSIFEAMGTGMPVVTTPVGGVPYWIRDGEQALLVDPRSAESLASGIERLLVDDSLRAHVAETGLEFSRDWTIEKGCELLADKLSDWSERARRSQSSRA
ncbi:MAG TPA: glycosyltransferase family 4 protein [Actinomycetota bacterium]|jgi:glycosyltransferase involved in cell wall biosynthesis|nr:glycosyltransferase family 4 protein [Actinomycetota bacterium]